MADAASSVSKRDPVALLSVAVHGFNLFVSSSYLVFSGITNLGDGAELIASVHSPILWRAGLIATGTVIYFLSMQAAALELRRFAGHENAEHRLYRLVWIPYTVAGIFACLAAVLTMRHSAAAGLAVASPGLNQTMGHGAALGLAAASSFGAGSGMFGLPPMQRGVEPSQLAPTVYLKWSAAWGVVAATVIGLFLFFIGPGLQ